MYVSEKEREREREREKERSKSYYVFDKCFLSAELNDLTNRIWIMSER